MTDTCMTLTPHILHYISVIGLDMDIDKSGCYYHYKLDTVPQNVFLALIGRAAQFAEVMHKVKAEQVAQGVSGWLYYGPTPDSEERIWPRVFNAILDGEPVANDYEDYTQFKDVLVRHMA